MNSKHINDLIAEMKREYMNNIHPSTPKATADAIVRTATKQVLRKTRADSWKGDKQKKSAEVAKKVAEAVEKTDYVNKSDGYIDANKVNDKNYRKARASGVTKQRRGTNRSTSMQKDQMTQKKSLSEMEEDIKKLKKLRKMPRCPEGYTWNAKELQCVPKRAKDDVGNSNSVKDSHPSNSPGFNVWGHTGVNGDGYAWAEKNNYGGDASPGPGSPEAVPFGEGVQMCARCRTPKTKCRCSSSKEMCVRCGTTKDRCRCLSNQDLQRMVLGR